MLLTPQQAGEKLCPFFRTCVNAAAVFQDQASAVHEHTSCFGPACIGWRWAPSLTVNNPNRVHGADGNQAGQNVKHEFGFCGFAGRP